MEKVLMKGNEALAEAAIRAGCQCFFGYPITPQSELPAYLAREMPKRGRVFLQAESEVAAINMVYGAAGAGVRVMTSSSSPGISLKQEGISYLCGAELPCVIVNIMRGGPGLGDIQPAQSDYFQATRGGGHGDYRTIVLAPASVQELVDLVYDAFDLADMYRNPVLILGDGILGQMMEPVVFKERPARELPPKTWATTGKMGRQKPNVINSLYLDPVQLEEHNRKLQRKYQEIEEKEARWEVLNGDDAEYFVVAYGICARIAHAAVEMARQEGIKVGLIRPITLWPYPKKAFEEVISRAKAFLTVELSCGQMVEDVKLSVEGRVPVYFYGRTGGMVPTAEEIFEEIKKMRGHS
ncbi:3-methyl-2-oxobutanoate dehydrogenase subunit VorB [Thermosediminibacter oceani]|uniref:Pyruvate flavodoxin/ferredoxin oxidoreductase domain protein n=1 Tax=Thermosediminibacter oceani (strain ATCC BAA-1034 / DSM 16646 / JW/IW-1228P) TaxID=555079 RepID=D9S2G9_THEOJ|nr:3-methyl-2-oxobutanoate dehydrogenase subunit VorB [Thermosediminibacter oceani]ADL07596.1 pyruvate flavodoxin/ferredoxin oxidoreductase domain protein [Thermosediminibacter oceani DSM 16646]